jgi:ABC-2 type transport system ATP-binding protein
VSDVVRISGLTKRYRSGTLALSGVDLTVVAGEILGFHGPNGRQTAGQLLHHLTGLRGGRSRDVIMPLAERLDLDLDRSIRGLSKGNRQKIGIVQALAHGLELLVLDEPSSGLDPLLRREFLDLVRPRAGGARLRR